MAALRRMRLIALGGTIASTSEVGDLTVTPRLSADSLLKAVPELSRIASVDAVDHEPVASFELGPPAMLAVAHQVAQALDEAYDGVVVTQGSDTLEEIVYLLALSVSRRSPVAVTGALRNPRLPGADGPANLAAAIRFAAHQPAGLLGPAAVLNDEVHLARWATKVHTSRTSAVQSPGAGPVDEIVEGSIRLWHAPLFDDYLGLATSFDGIDVALVRVAAGDEGRVVRGLLDNPPAGGPRGYRRRSPPQLDVGRDRRTHRARRPGGARHAMLGGRQPPTHLRHAGRRTRSLASRRAGGGMAQRRQGSASAHGGAGSV